MTKKDFIVRQLAKTNRKSFEAYVVTGIIHRLQDPIIKFVTQQHIRRPEGRRALTDLYFPQIDLHVEVDEAHHLNQIEADADREADIINATGHTIERVDVTQDIRTIDARINEIVDLVAQKVASAKEAGAFQAWDFDAAIDPQTYVEAGYMDARDDVAFLRIWEACNCFGHSYRGYQRAMAPHGVEPDTWLWFPKLYENDQWANAISFDESQIVERRKQGNGEFIEKHLERERKFRRLVFARVRGALGDVMYRFKGLYETDVEVSRAGGRIIYDRIATRVRTYPPVG